LKKVYSPKQAGKFSRGRKSTAYVLEKIPLLLTFSFPQALAVRESPRLEEEKNS
jgi:hypothetical protein